MSQQQSNNRFPNGQTDPRNVVPMQQQSNGRSLVRKLAEIMNLIDRIPKNGYNERQNYKFAREADISDAVRKLMADRHLIIFPNLVSKDVTTAGQTQSNNDKFLTSVEMDFTIVDGDSGEERTIRMGGQGIDAGDKGIYKATTGANKYALLKLFQIPTDDDPEKDGVPPGNGHQGQQQRQNQARGSHQKQQQGKNQRQHQQNQRPNPQAKPGYKRSQQGNRQPVPTWNEVKEIIGLLNWSTKQMMDNLNYFLEKRGYAPVDRFKELEPEMQLAFYDAMQEKFRKMIDQPKRNPQQGGDPSQYHPSHYPQ